MRTNCFLGCYGKGGVFWRELYDQRWFPTESGNAGQPSKGEKRYDKLARSYQITFCSYTVFSDASDYVNSFSMRHDVANELLSDAIHITFVELPKLAKILKKPVDDMTALNKWSVFFRYAPDRLPENRKLGD